MDAGSVAYLVGGGNGMTCLPCGGGVRGDNAAGALVDPGNPTSPVAKSIDSNGKVSDGPVGAMVTGYTIIKADSLDAAVTMARGCPVLKSNGQVTVFETFDVM